MAAIHAVITAVCSAGDHIVLPNDLYGGTYRLVDKVLSRWGLTLRPRRPDRPRRRRRRAARRDAPDLGRDADEPAAERRRRRGRRRPARARAGRRRQHVRDAGQPAPARARRRLRRPLDDEVPRRPLGHDRRRGRLRATPTGASTSTSSRRPSAPCPGPFDCFLVHRGLRTLHLRMRAHAESAAAVAAFLRGVDGVEDVRWPGFSGMVAFRHPAAIRHRGVRRGSSRSPSRSAASSR